MAGGDDDGGGGDVAALPPLPPTEEVCLLPVVKIPWSKSNQESNQYSSAESPS